MMHGIFCYTRMSTLSYYECIARCDAGTRCELAEAFNPGEGWTFIEMLLVTETEAFEFIRQYIDEPWPTVEE